MDLGRLPTVPFVRWRFRYRAAALGSGVGVEEWVGRTGCAGEEEERRHTPSGDRRGFGPEPGTGPTLLTRPSPAFPTASEPQ